MYTDWAALVVGIIATSAFFGNVLITIVGLKLPTHPKNLTQVFLISLAIADILLSVQVPFYIMGIQNILIESKLNDIFCSISSFLLWTAIKANIFMVMVMGIDRMGATCFAGSYLSKVKRQYAIAACIVVWVVSAVLAGIPGLISLVAQTHNPYSYDTRFKTCTLLPDFCDDDHNTQNTVFLIYFLIELVVTFGIPLISIVVCYVMICSRIFNLKKIKTIGRSISKRRRIISAKLGVSERRDRDQEAKQAALGNLSGKETDHGQLEPELRVGEEEEGSDGVKYEASRHEEKPRTGYVVQDYSDSSCVRFSTPEKGYEITTSGDSSTATGHDAAQTTTSSSEKRTISGFRLSIPDHSYKLSSSPTPSQEPICIAEGESLAECQDIIGPAADPPPTMKTAGKDPPAFSIDPSMQRRRFNFFTTEDDVCPEPDAKPSLIANSIQVIEKHYNAIESARDELAKKMRVYKYQIRVARTAVVVCTFFVVCYLAFEIGVLYVLWGVGCHDDLSDVSRYVKRCHLFLFVNSALNVLIYGMMHRTVRADIMKIVTVCIRKITSSDGKSV